MGVKAASDDQHRPEITTSLPGKLPCLVLNSAVLFPQGTVTVRLRMPYNLKLLEQINDPETPVAIANMSGEPDGKIHPDRLNKVGVVGAIINRRQLDHESVRVTLEGHHRIFIRRIMPGGLKTMAQVGTVEDGDFSAERAALLAGDCFSLARRLIEKSSTYPEEYINIIHLSQDQPSRFADLVASVLHLSLADRLRILEAVEVIDRLTLLKAILRDELIGETMAEELSQRARLSVERHQRELFLRAQLQEIRKELAQTDPSTNEIARFEQQIAKVSLPEDVEARALLELERLQSISTASAEYIGIRNYLEWLISLPWAGVVSPAVDLNHVYQVLDAEFYGQKKAKERLIEFLALPLKARRGGSVPCLVGPPGSGKTLMARLIARALKREFVSINLGLLRTETTLKGNRRTFPGAMPGRFLRLLAEKGVSNPICVLEDVDRLSDADRPDLSGIVLEAIGPGENAKFVDFYLGFPFDLSRVLFVATAGSEEEVPEILAERMEFIELPGYLEDEKIEIAFNYLLPNLIERYELDPEEISFTIGAIRKIIREYTLEAGLAWLKKNLESIFRRITAKKPIDKKPFFRMTATVIEKYLGAPVFIPEVAEQRPEVGVATGLAWTQAGGDLMMIEALRMRGSGTVTTTGYLGDVMKESIQAAHSYVRSRADWLGIKYDDFTRYDVHIHFPSGAIPKDGPSAGLTVCLVIASVMSNRPIRHDVAFTGEVSLRGKILPVGGLKEKIAAAHRVGISTVVIPKQNAKDLKEIPRGITKSITCIPLQHVDEVFEIALLDFNPAEQSLETVLRQELQKALVQQRKKTVRKKTKKSTTSSSRSSKRTVSGRKKRPKK